MSNRAEKMKKERKRTVMPNLRFPEFRGKPGWEENTGKSLFDQINDRNPTPGIPVLAITQEHGAIPRDLIDYHVSVSEKSIESYKVVHPGDFIISLRSFQGGIEYSQYQGICSPAYVVLRRRTEGSDTFFKHYLKSDRFIRVLTRNLEGLRDGKMISYKQFSELLLPVPSPPEQEKIANCLSSLDEFITAEKRKLEALRDHKRGLMQQLFPQPGETQPRLRFPEFRDMGEWERLPFWQIIKIASGQVNPTTSQYCNLPHIGGENIESHSGTIKDIKTAKELQLISGKYAFDEKDVLYSKIRPALNKVATPDFKGLCSADIYPIRPSSRKLLREFLGYLLLSDTFLEHAIKHSDRGKIPKINRDTLLAFTSSIPSPTEQQRIADCLKALNNQITVQAEKVESLKQHKLGLMQQLFPTPEESEA